SITRYLKCEVPHPAANHKYAPEEGKTMNENNRVLSRQNARELTPAEVDHVTGNINTLTICSWNPVGGKDCDTVG
ncbi:MAG TPA: hypothetical protein VHQ22_04400, partial [Terriglobales bacterium]|nr:hypothetical protein [Terriglobales bacterium]